MTLIRELALQAAATGAAQSPLAFMLNVMSSPLADPKMRLDAAKAAAPFVHTKPTDAKPGDGARVIMGDAEEWTAGDGARLEALRRHEVRPASEDELFDLETRWMRLTEEGRIEAAEQDAIRKKLGL